MVLFHDHPCNANILSRIPAIGFMLVVAVTLICIPGTESFSLNEIRAHHCQIVPDLQSRSVVRTLTTGTFHSRGGSVAVGPLHHHPAGPSKTSLHALRFPLIQADDTWGNFAALTGSATLGQILGRTTTVGKLLGAPVTAMALTFAMASMGVLNPGGTLAAKSLQTLTLHLATPLILLGADLRNCVSRCGPLLLSFAVASVATIVACGVGWKLCGTLLTSALGRDGLVIAAALMAKNVGGGINYIAVCRSLAASPNAVAAGLCVDNLFALVYFPVTTAIGTGRPDVGEWGGRTTSKELFHEDDDAIEDPKKDAPLVSVHPMTVQSMLTAICVSSILLWFGERMGGSSGALPLCTLLTVLFASQAPAKFMQSIQETSNTIGTTCLYFFFSTAGAPGMKVADSVKSSLVPLTLFLSCLYTIHGLILWLSNRLLWRPEKEGTTGSWRGAFLPQRLLVASSSAIGGPATSVALAKSNEWKSLEVPALLVGNIGYAIATFCGLAYYGLLCR